MTGYRVLYCGRAVALPITNPVQGKQLLFTIHTAVALSSSNYQDVPAKGHCSQRLYRPKDYTLWFKKTRQLRQTITTTQFSRF